METEVKISNTENTVLTEESILKNDGSQFADLAYFPPEKKIYDFVKRAFDIICSFFGTIVFSPIFLIVALAVKIEDRGPVIYKQARVGKDGNIINIFKFRSMKVNADHLEDVLTPEQLERYHKEFKLDNDPRITKVGNFLRKTSLDELPQLLNIFTGDLSLIGPRPLVSSETQLYGAAREVLLSVKPGLTGYWQAYARNNASYSSGERQRMELHYVHNRGVWMDIKIFFKTFEAIFRKTGAQ